MRVCVVGCVRPSYTHVQTRAYIRTRTHTHTHKLSSDPSSLTCLCLAHRTQEVVDDTTNEEMQALLMSVQEVCNTHNAAYTMVELVLGRSLYGRQLAHGG